MDFWLNTREHLYYWSALWISYFQHTFPDVGKFLLTVSSIGDPSQGFVLYFPIILALNYGKGVRYLGTFIVCEWLNMILKWILHEERPYWWVQLAAPEIKLKQMSLTCETGAGCPSGHSQASAVLIYCLIDSVLTSFPSFPRRLAFLFYFIFQSFIWLSRTFLAAHFPHQCILGFTIGLIIVNNFYTKSKWWTEWGTNKLLGMALFFPVSSYIVFLCLTFLGVDPNWSLELAGKYCASPSWVHVSTTPFYSVVRTAGAALGLVASRFNSIKSWDSSSCVCKVVCLVVGLLIGEGSNLVHKYIPRDPIAFFYVVEYFLNILTVFSILKIVQIILLNSCKSIKEN